MEKEVNVLNNTTNLTKTTITRLKFNKGVFQVGVVEDIAYLATPKTKNL